MKKKMPSVITVGATARGDVVVGGVTITHPDKALWPADRQDAAPSPSATSRAITNRAAHLMLPHIAGRPISIVRAPDGIAGQRFFQRHVLARRERGAPGARARREASPTS